MSSVLTYTKQIYMGSTYYNVPSSMRSAGSVGAYEFRTDTGYVTGASANLQANLIQLASTPCILRDMGKTVYAPYGSAAGQKGYYRQVQLLVPTAVTTFLGGPSGPTFGVGYNGIIDEYSPYFTFYIAVPNNGLLGATNTGAVPIAGGQM